MPDIINIRTWMILIYLHTKGRAKYKDIRDDLHLSDSVVYSRLQILKKFKLVKVIPVVTEEKNYFEYEITDKGIDFVEELQLKEFMKRISKIVPNFG